MGRQRFTFLKRELESGKGDRKALEELGDICLEQDDFNQAITYYQRAARQSGNTRVPATKLAYCFAKKRMFDLAGETLGDLRLSLDDNDEELEEMMVWIYKTAEVLEEARMFERASKLFKQLMKIDAGYKDVITRVEKLGRM
jgi:tetratricopeptide (TPR) repeat protein